MLDIGMPQLNGSDAMKMSLRPTMHEDPYLVGEAFRAAASAFPLQEAAASELTEAIAKVLKGGSYVMPSGSEGLTNISLREPKHREHARERTPR